MPLPKINATVLQEEIATLLPIIEAASALLPIVGPEVVTAEKFLGQIAGDTALLDLLVATYNQYVASTL